MSEVSEKIKSDLNELISIRETIRRAIATLNNPELENILSMRYLAYMNTQQIADDLHYDRRTIQRKQLIALDRINIETVDI